MSGKERHRLELMGRIKRKEITLVKAADLMEISYRQAKRIWKCFGETGDKSLIHGLRGKPGGRSRTKAFKQKVLTRYEERYRDFGPTLACEHLDREGMSLDPETLRRWLMVQGMWLRKRKRKKHRQWRERKEHLGELVQMDGSHQEWFEGRGPSAVLMVMVDDATNLTYYEVDCCKQKFGKWEIVIHGSFRDKFDELIPTLGIGGRKGVGSLPLTFVGEWVEFYSGSE